MPKCLTEEERGKTKELFERYKEDEMFTLKDIALQLKIVPTGVRRRFVKLFGEEYQKVAKRKVGVKARKVSDEHIRKLFIEYKHGKTMKELAESVGMKSPPLSVRMRKIVGKEYERIAKQKLKDKRKIQKVSDDEIGELFEIYKTSKVSLKKLAKFADISPETLKYRFEKLFKKEYKRLGKIKQYGRKIIHDEYRKAFEKYKFTDISLSELADELGISFETIREFFSKTFGEEYVKTAQQKYDAEETRRKGKLAESLAFRFLELTGLKAEDVRAKHVLEGTLKRPDFIVDDMFIEVKSYYLYMKSSGKRKGYEEVVSTYLGRKMKISDRILIKGMIISTSGFSPAVITQATEDGIKLVGSEDLEETFEKSRQFKLVKLLERLKVGNT